MYCLKLDSKRATEIDGGSGIISPGETFNIYKGEGSVRLRPYNRVLKQETILNHPGEPEAKISYARTVLSPRFSN